MPTADRFRAESCPPSLLLRRLLLRWLGLGLLLMLLLPGARGHSLWIGWLPYWLTVAPLLCLALLERQTLLHALRSHWAPGNRQRRRGGRQARRQPKRNRTRKLSLAALLGGAPPAV